MTMGIANDRPLHDVGAARFAYRACGRREGTLTLSIGDLPVGAGHVVAAGVARAVQGALEVDYAALGRDANCDDDSSFAQELIHHRTTASAVGVTDGSVLFGGEPVLQVFAPMFELFVLHPAVSLTVQAATATATLAARLVESAAGREVMLLDAGENTASLATYAAHIGGIRTGAAPVSGAPPLVEITAAHVASVLTASERTFHLLAAQGGPLVLPLGDEGAQLIHGAVRAVKETNAEDRLAAVLLDGSHLLDHARYVRRLLDAADLRDVKIIAVTAPDETVITQLNAMAPIDVYAVTSGSITCTGPARWGEITLTSRISGLDGAPARPLQIYRSELFDGDVVAFADEPAEPDVVPLFIQIARSGSPIRVSTGPDAATAARQHAAGQRRRLPSRFSLRASYGPYPVILSDGVRAHRDAARASTDDIKPAFAVD